MPIVLPPLIVATIGAIGAIAAIKWLAKEARRINAELHPEMFEPAVEQAGRERVGNLRRDPVSGVYRPE